ncbi:Lactadherin [Mizuhopecten yessoensis]|uniref:Lactadherin n=2 Tax=Mizuhopecten yessoensis TaxID=6573 RepID=A0A210Q4F6_MIZYE|nr:Lactadherin [Mizuhopecten yessoensis]
MTLLERRVCDVIDGHWFNGGNTLPQCVSKESLSSENCRPTHPPENGIVRCEHKDTRLVCTGTCDDGYTFVTHETTATRICDVTSGEWESGNVLPACKVAVVGNCTLPSPPRNGMSKCIVQGSELVCTAVCFHGYALPVALDNAKHVCTIADGVWYDGMFSFQTCQAITATDQCRFLNVSRDTAASTCHQHGADLVCDVECTNGFTFETHDVTVKRICDRLTGTWYTGSSVPRCVSTCEEHLISGNSIFSASSSWTGLAGVYFGPDRARLTSGPETVKNQNLSGGWRPANDDLGQFIQVKLERLSRITGIVTKGRGVSSGDTAQDVVTRFRVLYSTDGRSFVPYGSETVTDMFFSGNRNTCNEKVNWFSCPFAALYVRINPIDWKDHIGLRFELLGCPASEESVLTTSFISNTTPTTVTSGTSPEPMCNSILPPKNGVINCEDRGTSLVCTALCKNGWAFTTGDFLVNKRCDLNTHTWTDDQPFPACYRLPYVTTTTSLKPMTHDCIGSADDCHRKVNGDYHTCDNCHYFASCSEGYTYVRECPDNLVFDAVIGSCQYRSTTCTEL